MPEPDWGADLATAMAHAGRAVPVEQLLDDLLQALATDVRDNSHHDLTAARREAGLGRPPASARDGIVDRSDTGV